MSSHSRNSRKATQALHLAFAAALLAGSAAHAADQPRTFELAAFSNTLAGDSLVRGKYDMAFQQLPVDEHSLASATMVTTNRCVTLIVTRKLEEAHTACNAAVRAARLEITTLPVTLSWDRQEFRDYLALAYSNRAVLNYITNDAAAAEADLKKAEAVAPKAEFVARNLTVLQNRSAVAQVAVVPKS